MNKFCLLSISLIILNSGFADESEIHAPSPEIKILSIAEEWTKPNPESPEKTQTWKFELIRGIHPGEGIKKSGQLESYQSKQQRGLLSYKQDSLSYKNKKKRMRIKKAAPLITPNENSKQETQPSKKIAPQTPPSKKLNELDKGKPLLQKEKMLKTPPNTTPGKKIARSKREQQLLEKKRQLIEKKKRLAIRARKSAPLVSTPKENQKLTQRKKPLHATPDGGSKERKIAEKNPIQPPRTKDLNITPHKKPKELSDDAKKASPQIVQLEEQNLTSNLDSNLFNNNSQTSKFRPRNTALLQPNFRGTQRIPDEKYPNEMAQAPKTHREKREKDRLLADAGAAPGLSGSTNPPQPPSHAVQCHSPFHPMHVGLRHIEGRGIGYSTGYTTLEGFAIANFNPSFMPFFDIRGHVFDDGKLAGNVGIGERTILPSIDHILGGYLYYDVRQDRHRLTVNQLGPGIELLGKRMEYRVNGYFPVGNDQSRKYGFKFDEFKGHHILLKAKQRRALTGFDAEIGRHLTQSTDYDVYAGAGPYYFTTSHTASWGGQLRLLGRYKEYVSLEFSYSYDSLFRDNIQGSVAFNIPFGRKLKREGKNCSKGQNDLLLSRAAFSPYRFEIPVVKRISRKEKAINPATGNPWQVWFVDNTSSSNGTFKSPFSTLLAAQNASAPNDMIYVFPGDGTTTGMDMGIVLQDGQQLFGSGVTYQIHTKEGKIKIPAFSNNYPMITNTAGNVVVLGNGNQVSGMNISTNGNIGIIGNLINGATIAKNFLSCNGGADGVFIIGSGNINIIKNQLASSSLSGIGILVDQVDATFMKANISNNVLSGFTNGIDYLLNTFPTTASTNSIISGNIISGFSSQGVLYSTGPLEGTLTIDGNQITNNMGIPSSSGIAVEVFNFPSGGTVIINGNQVTTTTTSTNTSGISVATASELTAIISNNSVITGAGNASSGIMVFTNFAFGPTLCTSIFDNQVTQQASSGTHDISIFTLTSTGIINIDNLSGNTGSNISITGVGEINLVPPNSCGQ
jgi:hypothetical protein